MIKQLTAAAFIFLASITTSQAGGIPVIDATSIADRQIKHVETILKWKTQYDQMVNQIEQLKETHDSLTGSRGLGQIMNNPELKDYLPADWQEIYDTVNSGGYEGLTGTAKELYEASKIFDSCASLIVEDQRIACEARAVKPSQDKGFALDAYEKAKSRLDQIGQLMAQIDTTTDPKEIAELQGRIAAEQAMIANEQTKLQLYAMVAQAEERVQQQRKKELNAKANARRGWVQPTPIEFGE